MPVASECFDTTTDYSHANNFQLLDDVNNGNIKGFSHILVEH